MKAGLVWFRSRSRLKILHFCFFIDGEIHLIHSKMHEEEEVRLTVHIQAVVSDSFLSTQGWVGCLAAQRRAVVFPFHRDANGVGHAESLAVILLRNSTWTERNNELMQGTGWIDSVFFDHAPISLTRPAGTRGSLFAIRHKKLSTSCNVRATDLMLQFNLACTKMNGYWLLFL